MKTFLLTLLTCSPLLLFGQNNQIDYSSGGTNLQVMLFNEASSKYEETEGSPYLNDNFQPATISELGSNVYQVRYDAYKEQMQVKREDGEIIVMDKKIAYRITLSESQQTYETVRFEGKETGYGLVRWEKGNKKLLMRQQVTYLKGTASDGYNSAKPARFSSLREELYFSRDGKTATKLPNSKKALVEELFTESFMKSDAAKGLNPKREEDLIKLLELFYAED